MFDNPYDYQKFLLKEAFADEQGVLLRKRMHDLYSVPALDLSKWVLERIQWHGDERVLDLGSGPGIYLPDVLAHIEPKNYVGGDLSFQMLRALRETTSDFAPKILALDIEDLPFPDGYFDVVLANHVLEYVPDVEKAVQEIRRVLKQPKGIVVAATSSEFTMPEFNTLMQRAVRLLRRGTGEELNDFVMPFQFSLEQGTSILARHFPAVARYDIPNAFIFREAQPVTDYVESCRPFYEPRLPEAVRWEEFMTIMADQVRRLVDHFGELVVNKLSGVIIATEAGGFAEDYQNRLKETGS